MPTPQRPLVAAVSLLMAAVLAHGLFTGAMASDAERIASFYSSHGLAPLPPCRGDSIPIVLNPSLPEGGVTYLGDGCVENITLRQPDVRVLAHEVGHVYTARYLPSYGWYTEAAPEGMAALYTCRGDYAFRFFDTYYRYPPWGRPQEEWYYYGGLYAAVLNATGDWTSVFRGDQGEVLIGFLTMWPSHPVKLCGREFSAPIKDRVAWAGFPLRIDTQDYVEYWIVDVPPGEVRVDYGGRANVPLGVWFYVNGSFVLALVGGGTATVSWRPLSTVTTTVTTTVTQTATATVSTTATTTVTQTLVETATETATVTETVTVTETAAVTETVTQTVATTVTDVRTVSATRVVTTTVTYTAERVIYAGDALIVLIVAVVLLLAALFMCRSTAQNL